MERNDTYRKVQCAMAPHRNAVIDRWRESINDSRAANRAHDAVARIPLLPTLMNRHVAGFVHGRRVFKWPKGALSGYAGSFSHVMAQRFGERTWDSTRAQSLAARMQNSMWYSIRTPVHHALLRANHP